MKETVLIQKHTAAGAKMSPFGGYLMPIQYEGIIKEHTTARTSAVVFDTCHMGEFLFFGPDVVADLENILSCPVATLKPGYCRYGFICNETGGIIDDQIIYRKSDDTFFMVVNAATEPTDYAWITAHLSATTKHENLSAATAKIDLQGPHSPKICAKLMQKPIDNLIYYSFMDNSYQGKPVLLSRTGYTGEIGFELYCANDLAEELWDACISLGALPAGLGARDTLRLEMGFPLYGHELDTAHNAAWSSFSRALGSKNYIGSAAVSEGPTPAYRLCGIALNGRRSAHQHNRILSPNGETVGEVTSGSFSPSLGTAIAMGYILANEYDIGNPIAIATDRGTLTGTIAATPFYTKATGRAQLANHL